MVLAMLLALMILALIATIRALPARSIDLPRGLCRRSGHFLRNQ